MKQFLQACGAKAVQLIIFISNQSNCNFTLTDDQSAHLNASFYK